MDEGFSVKGSDARKSELTEKLEAKGAEIFYGQRAGNIQEGLDVVVYTAAIHPDNPEYAEAVKRGLPMLTRAELLGQIIDVYKRQQIYMGWTWNPTTPEITYDLFL